MESVIYVYECIVSIAKRLREKAMAYDDHTRSPYRENLGSVKYSNAAVWTWGHAISHALPPY